MIAFYKNWLWWKPAREIMMPKLKAMCTNTVASLSSHLHSFVLIDCSSAHVLYLFTSRTSLGRNQPVPTKTGCRNPQASPAHICHSPEHAISTLYFMPWKRHSVGCNTVLTHLNTMNWTTPTDKTSHYVLDVCEHHMGNMVWTGFICSSALQRISLEYQPVCATWARGLEITLWDGCA